LTINMIPICYVLKFFLQRNYLGTGSRVNFFFAKFVHKSKSTFLLLEDLINLKVTKYFKIFFRNGGIHHNLFFI
jgi:hypothetical protein